MTPKEQLRLLEIDKQTARLAAEMGLLFQEKYSIVVNKFDADIAQIKTQIALEERPKFQTADQIKLHYYPNTTTIKTHKSKKVTTKPKTKKGGVKKRKQ